MKCGYVFFLCYICNTMAKCKETKSETGNVGVSSTKDVAAAMTAEVGDALRALGEYCRAEDYAGWDPYDGLNSRVFRALPFVGRSAVARLVWIQLFKRNPLNMRRLLLVPKQHNAKGIALFLQGYCHLWHAVRGDSSLARYAGTVREIEEQINRLSDLLASLRTPGFSGAAWGYNFPWQCRREFLFPAGEPTVVATNFAAWALLDAAEITGRQDIRDVALTSADFVLRDLHRTPHAGGEIISYSKLPGNDTIYNASLLGARLLSRIYALTGREDCRAAAEASVRACCADQGKDGSWTYGVKAVTGWIDSFHTGYNLDGLIAYQEQTGDMTYADNIRRGLDYYLHTFFNADGSPKYYHNRQYPIDIHCPGQLPVTLWRTHAYDENADMARKVMRWTLKNMRSPKGWFYYQLKHGVSSHISYMRWSNAFMFCSLAVMLRAESAMELKGNGATQQKM